MRKQNFTYRYFRKLLINLKLIVEILNELGLFG